MSLNSSIMNGSSLLFDSRGSGNRFSVESSNPTPKVYLDSKKIAFIVNPKANNGKCGQIFKEEIIPILSKQKEKIVEITYTKCKRDGMRLAEKLMDLQHEIIICVGGDGTFYEVLNGVMNHELKNNCILGLLPLGKIF